MKTMKINVPVSVVTLVGCFLCPLSSIAQQIDSLDYKEVATGAFRANLKASKLKPNHTYQLTLNGTKGHPSNEILLKNYLNFEGEGYIDFKKVSTDAQGVLNTQIDRKLPKGQYLVKFLIKDPDNWVVVCSEDNVAFEVR